MREKLQRFMAGRYGVDQLNRLYIGLAFVLLILSMFTRWSPLYLLALVVLIYSYYRMFSRNTAKMYAQNQKFLNIRYKAVAKWNKTKNHIKQRKVYRFYRCPSCRQKVRVPKGKGKICITCPKCRQEFIKKS
ncbi:MAG: hypothetical protein ACI4DO_04935 [Roseburia sp.]